MSSDGSRHAARRPDHAHLPATVAFHQEVPLFVVRAAKDERVRRLGKPGPAHERPLARVLLELLRGRRLLEALQDAGGALRDLLGRGPMDHELASALLSKWPSPNVLVA